MKINVSSLTGAALEWAVASALGLTDVQISPFNNKFVTVPCEEFRRSIHYSEHWGEGGPIVEREKITLHPDQMDSKLWVGNVNCKVYAGPTPLVAAMRCFVASKLGDEVEIPEELS